MRDVSTAKKVVILRDSVLRIKIKKENNQDSTATETETENLTEITEIGMTGIKNKDTTDKIGIVKILMTEDIAITERKNTEDKGVAGKTHAAILLNTKEEEEILPQGPDLLQETAIVTTEVLHHAATATMMSEEEIVAIIETNTIEDEGVTLHAPPLRDDR